MQRAAPAVFLILLRRSPGWSRGVRWVDVEVVRQKGGRPTIKLHGEAAKISDRLGVKNISLSITHTADQAFAQVIFENEK